MKPFVRNSLIVGAAALVVVAGLVVIHIGGPSGPIPAPEHHFNWQVKVKAGFSKCGGVIVEKNWVVTAAHCLHAVTPIHESDIKKLSDLKTEKPFSVQAGSKNPADADKIDVCERPIIPDEYRDHEDDLRPFDIALIHLPLTPDAARQREIVQLNAATNEHELGPVYVVGWVCRSMLKRALQAVTPYECPTEMVYVQIPGVNKPGTARGNLLTAGGTPEGPGFDKRDSGSALTTATQGKDAMLIGIANHIAPMEDWYASVAFHKRWIESITGTYTHSPFTGCRP